MSKIKFQCPQCQGKQIDCVQVDVILVTPVSVVDDCVEYDEHNQSINDATTESYQCSRCSWVIPLEENDDDELMRWLEAQVYNGGTGVVQDEDQ